MYLRFWCVIILFLFCKTGWGCSCALEEFIENSIRQTGYIIKGKVIDVDTVLYSPSLGKEVELTNSKYVPNSKIRATVKVISYFKTRMEFIDDVVYVYTGMCGGGCGYYFYIGNEYIIYAGSVEASLQSPNHIKMSTNICTRTTLNVGDETELLKKHIDEIEYKCNTKKVSTLPTKEDIERTNYIIKGWVVGIDTVAYNYVLNKEMPIREGNGQHVFTCKVRVAVKVTSYFKTSKQFITDTVYVFTPYRQNMCGYDFSIGEWYLIYGYKRKKLIQEKEMNIEEEVTMDTYANSRTTKHFEIETMILKNFVDEKFLKP